MHSLLLLIYKRRWVQLLVVAILLSGNSFGSGCSHAISISWYWQVRGWMESGVHRGGLQIQTWH